LRRRDRRFTVELKAFALHTVYYKLQALINGYPVIKVATLKIHCSSLCERCLGMTTAAILAVIRPKSNRHRCRFLSSIVFIYSRVSPTKLNNLINTYNLLYLQSASHNRLSFNQSITFWFRPAVHPSALLSKDKEASYNAKVLHILYRRYSSLDRRHRAKDLLSGPPVKMSHVCDKPY
jgi:hypothetical protein